MIRRLAGVVVVPAVVVALVSGCGGDADDELHEHAVPEHSFEIHPGTQETQFSVDVPGQVAVELHGTGKTVATLLVRP